MKRLRKFRQHLGHIVMGVGDALDEYGRLIHGSYPPPPRREQTRRDLGHKVARGR
jgi:hypothetical protein